MVKCDVVSCHDIQADGDSLYCAKCRANWRLFLYDKGLKDKLLPERDVVLLKQQFDIIEVRTL